MIVSLYMSESDQLGPAALSGHGEVLGPISSLPANIGFLLFLTSAVGFRLKKSTKKD